MNWWTASAKVAWVRRNGVALTVLLGLVLVGSFAVAQSGIALLATARFGAGFGQIANTSLPNVVAASELYALSESLVATAPEIAGADSQIWRQSMADRLNDRLAALTQAIGRIDPAAIGPERLAEVQSQLETLATNLSALDGFVRERIDASAAVETFRARLPTLAARVREIADEALIDAPQTGATPPAPDRSRMIAWSAAGIEGITLMLATPSVRTASQVERMELQFAAVISRMEGSRQQLPLPARSKIDEMHQSIAQVGRGLQNIFEARRMQIEAETATQTALRLIQESSGRFTASVTAILRATQQEIGGRSEYFSRTISYFNLLIIATSLLSIAAGVAIFIYVRRAVIARLRTVQDYMRAQVEERPGELAITGEDEIAEVANSTRVFVARIANRDSVLRQRTDQLGRSVAELRALGEISQVINSTLDLDKVLTTIVSKATELSGTEAGAIYVFDDASQEFKLRATHGMDEAIIAAIGNRPIRRGETAIGEAAEKGHPIQITDVHHDRSELVLDVIVRAGFRALLIVPLLSADRIVGALVVRRKAPGEFAKSSVDLLQTFAAQSVLAISNARLFSENEKTLARLYKELDAARELQLGMLPHEFPEHSPDQPIEMHAFIEPAREVGGDLYDCFYAADHLCCFLVGDVADKGAPAAMFMARTSSLVRMAVAFWREAGSDITARKIVESVNRELCQNNDEDMFVTAFVGLLDARSGTIDYINAGHPAPYIVSASGGVAPIEGKSDPPLGLQNAATFHSHALTLQPGDTIFAYSDGIIEATNECEMFYGRERLRAALSAAGAKATPSELVGIVIKSAQTFTGAASKSDDVTALALRWLPL